MRQKKSSAEAASGISWTNANSWSLNQKPRSAPKRRAWRLTDLYLVVDVWRRKILAWDVHDREDAELGAQLISRAWIRVRISKLLKVPSGLSHQPFGSKEEACQWAAALVNWCIHEHRHSIIRFVAPRQRHSS